MHRLPWNFTETQIMKNLYAALAAIQSTGLVVVKERKNSALNSSYANLADIQELLRPQLIRHGLIVSFLNGTMRCDGGSWVVSITIRVVHVESGDCDVHTGEVAIPDKALSSSGREILNFAQRYGIGIAYGQRYMLVGYFAIVTGDDDDAQRAKSAMQERGTDAPPKVGDGAHWKLLCDGAWQSVEGPDGDLLGEKPAAQLASMWAKHPSNAALCAWAADRLFDSLQALQLLWSEFTAKAGGSWPEHLEDCTPEQLKQAATTAKSMRGTPQ